MRVPPRALLTEVNGLLHDFYAEHDMADFRAALGLIAKHYGITRPRIRWRQAIEDHDVWGLTFNTNRVHLYHPRYWARRPKWPTDERNWLLTFWHEMYHVVTFFEDEKRADRFAALAMED
ncbi:MAG: hypothetical protein AB7I42_22735 [Bradyrhizobium sp.]|uniref:hypothetical protein n=1 Tax=Bradyrhizobium sp. TaxID=376 RepID=UPI003D132247